jgi:hypothetical protein
VTIITQAPAKSIVTLPRLSALNLAMSAQAER